MKPSPAKPILFRVHWVLGLTAGFVLAVIGVTGALIGFEPELTDVMNPSLRIVARDAAVAKPISALIAAARDAYPGYSTRSVRWDRDHAIDVRLARGQERGGGIDVAVDPYSGKVLGTPRGHELFETAEQLHRNLAAGSAGKQIVGASTAMLLVIAITGLVLRWPRRARSVRAWLAIDTRMRGRALLRQIHSVLATWVLVFYAIAALTGLWWSYDFYRDAINSLAGVDGPQRRPQASGRGEIAPVSIDAAWTTFRREANDATSATINLTGAADAPIEIRYLTTSSPHGRAWNTLRVASDGRIVSRELYADLPQGRRFVASLFPLHSGDFFGWPGRIAMARAALLMPFFAITGIWLWIARRRMARRRDAAAVPARIDSTLQTGNAS